MPRAEPSIHGPRVLVMMAKEPSPGQVKTRLAPALGLAGAARLYGAFLDDLLDRLGRLPGLERWITVWPPGADPRRGHARAEDWRRFDQQGAGLGERMDHAFRSALEAGGVVVLIGSDAPTLPAHRILDAFRKLGDPGGPEVVLAPDAGGGYYLVGMRRFVPGLFEVPMSTASVFEETRERVLARGALLEVLGDWYDVDVPADLERLSSDLERPRMRRLAPVTDRVLRQLQSSDEPGAL